MVIVMSVPVRKNNVPLVRYVNFDVNVLLRRSCIYDIFSPKCIYFILRNIGNSRIKRSIKLIDSQTKGFVRGFLTFAFLSKSEKE